MITVKDLKEMLAMYEFCSNTFDGSVTLSENVISELKRLIANKDDNQELDLIDRNDYIGMVLWSEEDIKTALNKCDFDCTEENVSAVINSLVDGLNDCSSGWDYINYTITGIGDKLSPSIVKEVSNA